MTKAEAWQRQMTNDEAKGRIPDRVLPDFWVGDVAGLDERFASVL